MIPFNANRLCDCLIIIMFAARTSFHLLMWFIYKLGQEIASVYQCWVLLYNSQEDITYHETEINCFSLEKMSIFLYPNFLI